MSIEQIVARLLAVAWLFAWAMSAFPNPGEPWYLVPLLLTVSALIMLVRGRRW